jgi:hypothetical protein
MCISFCCPFAACVRCFSVAAVHMSCCGLRVLHCSQPRDAGGAVSSVTMPWCTTHSNPLQRRRCQGTVRAADSGPGLLVSQVPISCFTSAGPPNRGVPGKLKLMHPPVGRPLFCSVPVLHGLHPAGRRPTKASDALVGEDMRENACNANTTSKDSSCSVEEVYSLLRYVTASSHQINKPKWTSRHTKHHQHAGQARQIVHRVDTNVIYENCDVVFSVCGRGIPHRYFEWT